MSDTFSRKGEQTCEGNDRDSVECKDSILIDTSEMHSDTSRHKDQEDVEPGSEEDQIEDCKGASTPWRFRLVLLWFASGLDFRSRSACHSGDGSILGPRVEFAFMSRRMRAMRGRDLGWC